MIDQSPMARKFFRWTAFVAVPGVLWSAFEMYLLTLGGAQMLFFSIVHTMPSLVIVVLVGIAALVLVVLQSFVALIFSRYREKVGIPANAAVIIGALSALHLALLFTYDRWSSGSMRIAICLLGLFALGCLFIFGTRELTKKEKG
ncbi:MAG: hypothetical protein ACXU7Z_08090 [Burkholderiaceae bacterium]